ncbi:MAG TPA: TIGR00725 family protein [Actinocrinis sp.]|nr:TIGR00725 family protein [Actinocrinis sp.]
MPDSPSRPDPRHAPYIAVIGPGEASDDELRIAEQVGALLAQRGATVVCGGLGGVMQAVCKGAAQHDGPAIGLLPGRDRSAANPYVSVALATGLGEMRNALVVGSSDGVIAVGGSWGTLSEVALAMRTGKPTVVIGGWSVQQPSPDTSHNPAKAATAQDAVDAVLAAIDGHGPHQNPTTQDDPRP